MGLDVDGAVDAEDGCLNGPEKKFEILNCPSDSLTLEVAAAAALEATWGPLQSWSAGCRWVRQKLSRQMAQTPTSDAWKKKFHQTFF